ncbi:hypothetical protein HMPREF0574_1392 [Mobiluncus curtisii subsp. curtisii ATCC 35241]|nr:hypothetical protein HMPREF0574_1392 [Mobiluncus curtisii subsp. curtisii ATCC 35241]
MRPEKIIASYIQHRVKKLTPSQKPNESSTLPGHKEQVLY